MLREHPSLNSKILNSSADIVAKVHWPQTIAPMPTESCEELSSYNFSFFREYLHSVSLYYFMSYLVICRKHDDAT